MWFLAVGVVLLLMKGFDVDPVGHWSWWIVLLPFGVALLWFEVIEPYFGFDRKKAHDELEKTRGERVKKTLAGRTGKR